jgi:hypothetical protein
MPLIAIRGSAQAVNMQLMEAAFANPPSLIVDCANYADPHMLFPAVSQEELDSVYVLNAEAIYRFRDTMIKLPYWIGKLGIKGVLVTTINTLFAYDDEEENRDVLEHSWQIMKRLGKSSTIRVGIIPGTVHEQLALIYADQLV